MIGVEHISFVPSWALSFEFTLDITNSLRFHDDDDDIILGMKGSIEGSTLEVGGRRRVSCAAAVPVSTDFDCVN